PFLLPVPYDEDQLPAKARKSIEFSRSLSETFLQLDYKAKNWVEVDYTKNLYYVEEGTVSSQLEESKQPWIGSHWQFGTLTRNRTAPLKLYDRFIEAVTGNRGQAADWEDRVRPAEENGGHCNGWSAAAVLYPEPTEPRQVPEINARMSVKKLKGLLTASSFCVHWAFYGKRFYLSSPEEEKSDIDPGLFHRVLLYYIKQIKKPVAMDYFPGYWVDNHVISGFDLDIKKSEKEGYDFYVVAKLNAHYYHERDEVGIAPTKSYTYKYHLKVTPEGLAQTGEWDGNDHPDFLWVPLATRDCGRQNPHLKKAHIETMVYGRQLASDRRPDDDDSDDDSDDDDGSGEPGAGDDDDGDPGQDPGQDPG
ncbi:MAG: hypothetical protein AAF202_13505, partial [Pseudomonadota bacterium]